MTDRRQEILDAAMAIADEGGLDAVSMRAVADRVGVTPMALYRHVSGKDALLDGLLGRLLAELRLPDDVSRAPWDERLRAAARAYLEMARRHPWSATLLFARPAITPDAIRLVEFLYTALSEAGVPDSEIPRVERMISTFTIGFAASEAAGRFSMGTMHPSGRRGQFPDGDLPSHGRLAGWLDQPVSITDEFDSDVADILRMIHVIAGVT